MGKTASGEHVLRFEHPTQPGQQAGGWMTTASGKPGESAGFGKLLEVQGEVQEAAPAAGAPKAAASKKCTLAEVEKHNTEADNNYNCTSAATTDPSLMLCTVLFCY